jgi:hypothetical protein
MLNCLVMRARAWLSWSTGKESTLAWPGVRSAGPAGPGPGGHASR